MQKFHSSRPHSYKISRHDHCFSLGYQRLGYRRHGYRHRLNTRSSGVVVCESDNVPYANQDVFNKALQKNPKLQGVND